MPRPFRLFAPALLLAAVHAAAIEAQEAATSVVHQLQEQTIFEALRAQQHEALRSLTLAREGGAPGLAAAGSPSLQVGALEAAAVRHQAAYHQNRRWSHALFALGATALIGGVADHVRGQSPVMSGSQLGLIGGGLGVIVVSGHRWQTALEARAQLERVRAVQLASGTNPTGGR
jgi:hypothetical protein